MLRGVNMKENRRLKRQELAITITPLFEALANGDYLEFKHNDGVWRLWDGFNLTEITLSPHRFRVAI